MTKLIKSVISLSAIAACVGMILPPPADARNQFDTCINRISDQGVDSQDAGNACADALIPKELAGCVARITSRTGIPGDNALDACQRVRRPTDLSRCVVDIDRQIIAREETTNREDSVNLALDSCRRSLIPSRYAECVVGLTRSISTTPTEAMSTCLSAQDFPERVLSPAP